MTGVLEKAAETRKLIAEYDETGLCSASLLTPESPPLRLQHVAYV